MIETLSQVLADNWISEVLYEVKSGKEASVFCCRGGARAAGHPLIAAKVYKDQVDRSFRNDSIYQAGRVHLAHNTRIARAVKSNSEFGQKIHAVLWLEHEWSMLNHLYDAGCDVPQPIHRAGRVILMPFYGDETAAVPRLNEITPTTDEADALLDQVLQNVTRMLNAHHVHGDLSPYNVLYVNDEALIIDLPQAVDARLNPAAYELLVRDVGNICAWAIRHGVDVDANEFTTDLWTAFQEGEIG